MNRIITIPFIFLATSVAAETATVIMDSRLYQRPSIQASLLKTLKRGSHVEIETRSGGWKQISDSESSSGWVRSYQIRDGIVQMKPQESSSGGFFSGLASLSRKASGLFSSNKKGYSFQNTATIGVRGLSEEEIRNAVPDLAELKKMESFRSSKKKAKKYAKKGKLSALKLKHMPKSGAEK